MINKKIIKHSFITLSLSLLIQVIGIILFVLKFPDLTVDELYLSPYVFYTFGIPLFANAIMAFFVKDWNEDYKKVFSIVFALQVILDFIVSPDKDINLHLMAFLFYFIGFVIGILFNSFYKKI
tara:strand:- start:754 stop:1122 length:369 start_codon:yes stop_codon:yes gene_type:complete